MSAKKCLQAHMEHGQKDFGSRLEISSLDGS